MDIIIQKFGGTSLANDEIRCQAIDKIELALKKDLIPVVVVSAIGRAGDPYSTDSLINFVSAVGERPNPRELDLLMSCGEVISAVALSNALRMRGYYSQVLTGGQAGIITDDKFLDAKIIEVKPEKILKILEKGRIPIITGFQGITKEGEITTLGRGGSDVTATILGEALEAKIIEIYTDVDGVMTADPKIVPDAQVMDTIFYNEVFQMSEYGAKVLHPRAVEVGMRANIPIVIRNTASNYKGTLITSYNKDRSYKIEKDKIITSIAQIDDRIQVKVLPTGSQRENQDKLFEKIAEGNISIDMINIYPDIIFFIIDRKDSTSLERVLNELNYKFDFLFDLTKITIIGNRMAGVPGVMAKTLSALNKERIEILQTSDSHTTISCLIESKYTKEAANILHKHFGLGN